MHAWVKRLGIRSITLAFAIEKSRSTRVADCEIVLVCVDRATFKSKKVPAELRAALEGFTASA